MALQVCIDKITDVEASEREGRLVRLRRVAIVTGEFAEMNYKQLFEALEDVGIPTARSPLDGAPDLFLLERNPTLKDETTILIDLIYEPFYISEDVDLSVPPYGVLEGGQSTSIQQVQTNKDVDGKQIILSHTYPPDHPDLPNVTVEQGGEVTIFEPQKTFTLKFIRNTSTPWVMSDQFIGRINSNVWRGEPKNTWMCSAVNWFLHRVTTSVQYRFEIEFQHSLDTWNPTAVFKDATGEAPPNLVEGVGFKTIEKLKAVDFDQLLGSPVTGIST